MGKKDVTAVGEDVKTTTTKTRKPGPPKIQKAIKLIDGLNAEDLGKVNAHVTALVSAARSALAVPQ